MFTRLAFAFFFSNALQGAHHTPGGRATIQSIRHITRSIQNFNQRHLHLGDNLGMVLAFDRGRAKSAPLLLCCRKSLRLFGCQWMSVFSPLDSFRAQCRGLGVQILGKSGFKRHLQKPDQKGPGQPHLPEERQGSSLTGMEGKAHSPLVIHALKQAVHQEVPSMTAVKMPELRRSIRAKDQKDRIAKRANMRKTSSPVQRFAEQTVLESFAVSHSTALDYYKIVLVFQNYCFLLGLSITNATQVDHSLTEFLNQAFFEALDISEASKFYAAVLEAFPFVGKTGLIRSRRALKGWRNLDPGQSRTPLAWPLVAYIAMALLQLGNPPAALCVLTMFTTYMRPSEALKLRKCDLVVSRHLQVSWALNLNAQEEDNPFKSRPHRRDDTAGQPSPALHRTCSPKAGSGGSTRSSFWTQLSGPSSSVAPSTGSHRPRARLCSALPAQAFRSLVGSFEKAAQHSGHQAEGKMVIGQQPEALRVPCKSSSDVREVAASSSQTSGGIASIVKGNGYRIFCPVNPNQKKTILELYAGCASLSKSLCRHGFTVHAYDVQWGSGGNVLDYNVFQKLCNSISSGYFSFVHFGMPCESWSRARKWDGGPQPLRNDSSHLYGFTDLVWYDELKVKRCNTLLQTTYKLALGLHQ